MPSLSFKLHTGQSELLDPAQVQSPRDSSPVWVRRRGDEEAVDLVLAGGAALDEAALVVDVVELAHAVEEVVHAGEVGADAHLVLLHRVLAPHLVEA